MKWFLSAAFCCIVVTGCARLNGGDSLPAGSDSGQRAGAHAAAFRVLHHFGKGSDGVSPQGELVRVSGALYGTTSAGGTKQMGTAFAATASGAERVLYDFGDANGVNPQAQMTFRNGKLYGTTLFGGAKSEGTVFSLDPTSGSEHVLHSFAGGKDGSAPRAGLTFSGNTFYGTVQQNGTYQAGTVFAITPSGAERVVHEFNPARNEGGTPSARLIQLGGAFYGTTQVGGSHGAGTVYRVKPDGTLHVLYSFAGGNDASTPYAGLTSVNGALYGTSFEGGTNGDGTVFKVTAAGAESVVYSFGQFAGDAGAPEAGMILVNGMLYGTTSGGGAAGDGAVFRMTLSGAETVLHSFSGTDGSDPVTGLTNVNGVLYGVASQGGKYGGGTLFSLAP